MKKYIYSLMATFLVATAITSCKDEEGTVPGSDPNPSVIVYSYGMDTDPDCDALFRIANNDKVSDVYYLAEKTSDKEARVASVGDDGYLDYVVQNGTKVSVSGESNTDVYLTLTDAYTFTAVGVSGSNRSSSEATFTGVAWEDVCTGTYKFGASKNLISYNKLTSNPCTLQVNAGDKTQYRFKNSFGAGSSLKITMLDIKATDSDGEYQYFRVPAMVTPYTYGSYGAASVRDLGYWQGNDAYVTTYGYESGMYTNYNCFICVQYYVSAGNLGYGYDYFIPD